MRESRDLAELLPIVRGHAVAAIAKAEMRTGMKIIVSATYRDDEMQRFYYHHLKSNDPGPGAPHSLRIALDIAPAKRDPFTKHDVLDYNTPFWPQIAQCFKE